MGGDDSLVVSERVLVLDRRAFTAAELLVVMAILGLVAAASMPSMISYWRAATLRAAAEELAAGLNGGRQLAISQAQRVCVEVANNIGVTTNANPVFDYLGAANPGATLTVTNPQDGATLNVVVSVAGRVRIGP